MPIKFVSNSQCLKLLEITCKAHWT